MAVEPEEFDSYQDAMFAGADHWVFTRTIKRGWMDPNTGEFVTFEKDYPVEKGTLRKAKLLKIVPTMAKIYKGST